MQDAYIVQSVRTPGCKQKRGLFKETRPDISIILLTANVPEEKYIEAIKLGAMDVIEKPADLNLLTQKIEEAKARKLKQLANDE